MASSMHTPGEFPRPEWPGEPRLPGTPGLPGTQQGEPGPVPETRVWLDPQADWQNQLYARLLEKRIVMVSDGPQGPSILYSDATTEPVPSEDVEPRPLIGDINFEETRAGFEVWFSPRLVQDLNELIEDFTTMASGMV